MFHQVKIMNSEGKVKKVVPSGELSQRHWSNFQSSEDRISLTTSPTARVPRWVKEKLDMEFPSFYEMNASS